MFKKVIIAIALLMLPSCGIFGSYYEAEPVGVGKAIDELKLSPCACMQLDLPNNLPDWFIETL